MVHHTAHTSGGVPTRASAGHNTDAARMAGLCGCGVGWWVADRLRDGRVLWWAAQGVTLVYWRSEEAGTADWENYEPYWGGHDRVKFDLIVEVDFKSLHKSNSFGLKWMEILLKNCELHYTQIHHRSLHTLWNNDRLENLTWAVIKRLVRRTWLKKVGIIFFKNYYIHYIHISAYIYLISSLLRFLKRVVLIH